jgi:hypothetical protein
MTTKFCIFTVHKKVAGSFFQIVRQRSLREISGSDRDDLLDEHHRGFNAILLFSFVTSGAARVFVLEKFFKDNLTFENNHRTL